LKILEFIQPIIEAEDELRERAREAPLTPDRYKQLLVMAGVDENIAETERAKLELSKTIRESNATSNPIRVGKRIHR